MDRNKENATGDSDGVPHRIDVHHHIFPPGYRAALRRSGITKEGGVSLPPWSVEHALAVMDRQSIAVAITSISAPGVYVGDPGLARELARECNEFAAALITQNPHRFGSFAVLPLPDIDASLEELAYALDVLRLDGVIVLSSVEGHYLGDVMFDPLFDELNRRRTPTFVHPNTPRGDTTSRLPSSMVDYPFDTAKAVANLLMSGSLERYSDLPLILSHAGGAVPFLAWRYGLFMERLHIPLRDLAVHASELVTHRFARAPRDEGTKGVALLQRLYYDLALSASPYAFPSLLALVDPSHILFGTDLGIAGEFLASETVRGITDEPLIDNASRLAIESGNALGLFPRLRIGYT